MQSVSVQAVRVDDKNRIRVCPVIANASGGYALIYRAAAWVRWDPGRNELFVASEKEEDLEEQFARISNVLLGEFGERLSLSSSTDFSNVPKDIVDRLVGQFGK